MTNALMKSFLEGIRCSWRRKCPKGLHNEGVSCLHLPEPRASSHLHICVCELFKRMTLVFNTDWLETKSQPHLLALSTEELNVFQITSEHHHSLVPDLIDHWNSDSSGVPSAISRAQGGKAGVVWLRASPECLHASQAELPGLHLPIPAGASR